MPPSVASAEHDPPDIATLIAGGHRDAALEVCSRNYARPIGRMCFAMVGSASEAEEIVQETLVAAYHGFATYRGEGSVRGWLFGIARHLCARQLSTRTRRAARLHLVGDEDDSAPAPEERVLRNESAARARAALVELCSEQREAVVLRYEAGLSFRDVAMACGCDEATARKRVSRALARLRDVLSDDKR